MRDHLKYCEQKIELMLRRSQTKVIFPIITFGLLNEFVKSKKDTFSDHDVQRAYEEAVDYFKSFLKHNLHIGGKYYDAYPTRNLPKYGVLEVLRNRTFRLLGPYKQSATDLLKLIPAKIKSHIENKLGIIPRLGNPIERTRLSIHKEQYLDLISEHIDTNPINFEVFCFAIIKVHLEKFACKVYRDTRTSAHDKGVDISTNFGVVYQIKKLKILNKKAANEIYDELRINFDSERLTDGKVILIIDDISEDVKSYLINMKVQSISKNDLVRLAEQLELEERERVLRIVFEEFSREYSSRL
jgi:hypothetical protein